jgi:hypothetical protein
MERYTERLMGFWLLLKYLKPIVRALCVLALKGIIAPSAQPLVHLPLPSVPINTTRLGTYTFEGSVFIRPSVTILPELACIKPNMLVI